MQSADKAGCIIFQLDISKDRRQSHQVRLPAASQYFYKAVPPSSSERLLTTLLIVPDGQSEHIWS